MRWTKCGKPANLLEVIPAVVAAVLGNVVVVERTADLRPGVWLPTKGFVELSQAPSSLLDLFLGRWASVSLAALLVAAITAHVSWAVLSPAKVRTFMSDRDTVRARARIVVRMLRRAGYALGAGIAVASVAWVATWTFNRFPGLLGQCLALAPCVVWWQFVFDRFMGELAGASQATS
jgi:hypothetical protein